MFVKEKQFHKGASLQNMSSGRIGAGIMDEKGFQEAFALHL